VVHYYGNIKRLLPFPALNYIQILIPQPGPTTGEMLLDLLQHYPDGASIGELSYRLNRLVSMLSIAKRLRRSIVLKLLMGEKKVRAQRRGMQRVYFLR
jgi:hypothetical protein